MSVCIYKFKQSTFCVVYKLKYYFSLPLCAPTTHCSVLQQQLNGQFTCCVLFHSIQFHSFKLQRNCRDQWTYVVLGCI